jgi:hypothetical protein
MQLRRARFLSFASNTHQGASGIASDQNSVALCHICCTVVRSCYLRSASVG